MDNLIFSKSRFLSWCLDPSCLNGTTPFLHSWGPGAVGAPGVQGGGWHRGCWAQLWWLFIRDSGCCLLSALWQSAVGAALAVWFSKVIYVDKWSPSWRQAVVRDGAQRIWGGQSLFSALLGAGWQQRKVTTALSQGHDHSEGRKGCGHWDQSGHPLPPGWKASARKMHLL